MILSLSTDHIANGYKMIGNAVPVNFGRVLANKILVDIQEYQDAGFCSHLRQVKIPTQLSLLSNAVD